MASFVRIALLLGAAFVASFFPSIVSAHSQDGDEQAAVQPALLSALVALGGGPQHFSAGSLRRALSAGRPDEEARLRAAVGSASVDRFDAVFTYVVQDGVATMSRGGTALPPPASTEPKAVAQGLYRAGLRNGAFDVERLFDVLFSPAVHDHAMVAVGRKYGQAGETAYHVVLARLIQDVGQEQALRTEFPSGR